MKSKCLWVLYKKEMADHLKSRRFFIILMLVVITGFSAIYAAAYGISSAVEQENNSFVFLRLFTTSGSSIPSFVAFISFLGPLVGLSLGFDSINGEVNRGSLSRLLAQPIPRDTVINGKFLAGVSVITLMMLSMGLAIGGLGIIMIGIPPTSDEILRILAFLIFSIFYISLWLAISQLFSLLLRQTATSALACIAVWLFLSVFIGLLSGVIADVLYPADKVETVEAVLRNSKTELMINRISPSTVYNEAVITMLNPGVRTLGFITQDQLVGAIPGTLPFFQSLLLTWPHLVSLIAATMICFAVSYVYFMKQEVRM
ncbi:MAG: ABC transporter permease [Clostridiaceae bacterium]|jgi:ABC-2 type transport system permease protein|nr:ABC transporter permease [Clostridiaceae bacterium]